MKFEETIAQKQVPEWINFYINYSMLKALIRPYKELLNGIIIFHT